MLQPNAPDLIQQAPLTGKEDGLENYVAWTRHKKASDADVGIEEFASQDLVGIGGLVKARWTDFRVNEVRLRDGQPVGHRCCRRRCYRRRRSTGQPHQQEQ
jgi:hypothetical protein